MSAYGDMNITSLYSSLGYGKNSNSTYEALDVTAHSFFREYTNRGNKISVSKKEVEGARLCALNFLHEDDRGEHFWPVNSGGTLEWANDADRETIIDILTHVFRLKSFSDYVKERKQIRDREREGDREARFSQWQKPKRVKKRTWKLREDDDEDYQGHTTRDSTQNLDPFVPSSLEPTTVKPWNNPPEEPSAKFCGDYIRNLNPHYDEEPVAGFKKMWLSKNCAEWPLQADQRLLRFMFDHDFFITYDYGDDLPAELLRSLRQNTEIEQLKMSEVVEFRNRVKSRVVELTKLLTTKPYFILAYRRDGVVRMTDRFERMWKRKDVYWEEDPPKANAGGPRPVKKRKKSKPIRAKTPIVFPNLREQDDAITELLSAQVETSSRMELASMAETALELSVGQEESQTQWLEQSFFDVFMRNDDSEFELDAETPKRTVTKSASPDDGIVADFQIKAVAEASHNTLLLSPTREMQHSEEEALHNLTLESTLSIDGEAQQCCILENPTPSQTVSTSPSQDKMTETVQTSGNAENIESLAKYAQDPITTFFTPMEDLSDTGWSRASPNQSVSPSVSTTSRSFGRTNSASTNTSISQHLQHGASIGGDHMARTCPPKDFAEFSGLGPQRPITTGAKQLSDEIPAHDETPGLSSDTGQEKYHSPYLGQIFKEPEFESADRHNSSSMPGSSRSAPLEIVDDSDHPQSPSSISTKLSSTIVKPPSPQTNNETDKPLNENLPAAVQPNPGNHSLQNSMSLNNILSPEIEFTPIKLLYHHHTIGKTLDVPSTPSHPPPPPLHSVHTNSSQPAQSSPSYGSITSNPPTLDPDQQGNPSKPNPSLSGSNPFYAPSFDQQNLTSADPSPSVPSAFSAPPTFSVSPRSQTIGVPAKEKAGTWPLQSISDTWNPTPPNMVHTPSNNNEVPGPGMIQNPWPSWPSWDTPSKDQSIPDYQSRNYVGVPVAPMANMYSEISGSSSFAQVRNESAEKSINRASTSNLSPAQASKHVEQPSTLFYPQQSTSTSPTEQGFHSQKLPEEPSSHQFSQGHGFHNVSLNASPASANPLTLDTRTIDNSKSADVDDFISSIDDFIQREGGPVMEKKVLSDGAPSTNTTDQPWQLRSHSPQGPSSEAGQMQASQNLHLRGQPQNAAKSPGAQARATNLQGDAPSERATFHPEQISSPKPQSPSSESPLNQELSNQSHENTPSPITRPLQCPSSSQDMAPRTELNVTLPAQESMAPPKKDTPKRNGSYSFVPPPEAFSPYKSETTPAPAEARPPPAPVLSTDRRLTTTRDPSKAGNSPVLTLLIESADGNMSLDTTHPFEIVEKSSSSEFFQFYSSVSGTPLSSLTNLEFQVAFGKRQSIPIRRYGSEEGWKRLREVIPSLFDRAVRKDTHGRMEWQVLVSSE